MKRILIALLLLLLAAGAAACRGTVTETGNPCPGGDCTKQPEARNPGGGGDDGDAEAPPGSPSQQGGECDDATAELLSYTNEPYEVTIGYPDCWELVEKEEGDPSKALAAVIELTKAASATSKKSTVAVQAALLSGMTIQTIAANRSPGCALKAYAASGLTGYRCDLSAAVGIHRQYTITKGAGVYLFIDAAVADAVGLDRMLQNIVIP